MPSWSTGKIQPDETGSVTVLFDPENRPGEFTKKIKVFTNSQDEMTELTIIGNVIPMQNKLKIRFDDLRSSSKYLDYKKLLNTQQKTVILQFQNSGNDDLKIKFEKLPKYLKILDLPANFISKEIYAIKFELNPQELIGNVIETVPFEIVSERKEKNHKLRLIANVSEDFSYLSEEERENAPEIAFAEEINLGKLKRDEIHNFQLRLLNNGKSDLIVRKVEAGRRFTVSEFDNTIEPGREQNIAITLQANFFVDEFSEVITIISNDPEKPVVEITIIGKIK